MEKARTDPAKLAEHNVFITGMDERCDEYILCCSLLFTVPQNVHHSLSSHSDLIKMVIFELYVLESSIFLVYCGF